MNKKYNFAIITDFGFDYSIASMKALILSNFPEANIIDIDHSIEKFSILSAAFIVNSIYNFFPKETIFICVVDPGVGSKRDIMYFNVDGYHFIGPNNGVFHYIIKKFNSLEFKKINENSFPCHSNTFHGRDIMTPAAIELAKGNKNIFSELKTEEINFIKVLEENSNVIIYADNFGNIKTNIPSAETNFDLFSEVLITINEKIYPAIFLNTFSEVERGGLICYKGSNDTLEIAINMGSARDFLSANIGDKVKIELK